MVQPSRRVRRSWWAFTLVSALLVTACQPSPAVPSGGHTAAERVVAGSRHGRTAAHLRVGDAASVVEVRLATLPGLLYRISTPARSGLAPRVTGGPGRVQLALKPTGEDGPDTVLILLNRAVRWDVRLPAGAGEQRLDLSAGSVSRVDLGPSGLLDLALPAPHGTVPVILRGGVGTVTVTAPHGVPVRLRLREGARSVTTPWPSGADPAWPRARHRYVIDSRAALGSVTVRHG
jgi:hypothetical protein